jgi:hypothetical protein
MGEDELRILMITAALVALGACNRAGNNTSANAAAANKAAPANNAAPATTSNNSAAAAPAAAGGLPPGFPDADPLGRALQCAALLEAAREAGATPGGRDAPIMEQAEGQWRASLQADSAVDEEKTDEQVTAVAKASSTLPVTQRDAAAAWCVENAPEVDPEG